MALPHAPRHGVLDRLRHETCDEHLAIEDALGIMRAELSMAEYLRVLQRFFGFYDPLETRLATLGKAKVPTHTQKRAALLHADLVTLGGPKPSSLPRCTDLPDLIEPAQAWGCLYVLESAALGGQVIGRHVERTLAVVPSKGGRFFHGEGERTGARWRAFRTALVANVVSDAQQDTAVASALATFRAMRGWCAEGFTSPPVRAPEPAAVSGAASSQ